MVDMRNRGPKGSLRVKFKDNICAESCLKLWFKNEWYFCNITESGWFWKRQPRNKVPNNHFLKTVWKSNSPEAHCGTKHQFPHTRFHQISDHKHDICLYGKLSTKLLAQGANKNTNFMFTKTGRLLFFSSLISEVTVLKNSKQTIP